MDAPRKSSRVKRLRAAATSKNAPAPHALGHILATVPLVLHYLSTVDATHLRRVDKQLRNAVAEHPWKDTRTLVSQLVPSWRASFPAATAIYVKAANLTKHRLQQLTGLKELIARGSFNCGKTPTSLPLTAVTLNPHLTTLHMTGEASYWNYPGGFDPDESEWGQFRSLSELSIEVHPEALTESAINNLKALHKLAVTFNGGDPTGLSWPFSLTDNGLAALPLLESLAFRCVNKNEIPDGCLFSGVSLAVLSRLSLLSLDGVPLAPGALAHLQHPLSSLTLANVILSPDDFECIRVPVLALSLVNVHGLDDSTLAAPALSSLQSFCLTGLVHDVSPESFASISKLETLDIKNVTTADATFMHSALCVLPHLRRLRYNSNNLSDAKATRLVLSALKSSGCPLSELSLTDHSSSYRANSEDLALLPTSLVSLVLPRLYVLGKLPIISPWARLTRVVVLDLKGSIASFVQGAFSALQSLRTLNLTACHNASQAAVLTLPSGVTSLDLDNCEQLELDDASITVLAARLPGLSHMSLQWSLISERRPAFRANKAAVYRRLKPELQKKQRAKAKSRRAMRGAWDSSDDDESSASEEIDDEDESGVAIAEACAVFPKPPRRVLKSRDAESEPAPVTVASAAPKPAQIFAAPYKARQDALRTIPTPRCITPVGWAALVRSPRGFFSLDVRHNLLTYESYTLLLQHVTNLRAGIVKSPEEVAAGVAADNARRLAERAQWQNMMAPSSAGPRMDDFE